MNFREDIQVLRGISVLFVVLFHLGFSPLIGGFLGVDVFFVISGFLMAILYDFRNKKEFFKRRARRLLPPYFFIIILTVFFAFVLTTPNETRQVVEQSFFSVFFASNIGFWIQNSYFSKAEFNPLLHLWSLGVEIQFYLLVPLLSWFFRKSKVFLPLILFMSLTACFLVLTKSPKTSFFMLPFRLWEFLIGFGIAKSFTSKGQIKFKGYEWIGLISAISLVVIPFMPIDGNSLNVILGHPGLASLIICLATGGVLVFGLPLIVQKSVIGQVLVWFGKYSYSIYLVHFPIIVLFLFKPFGGTIVETSSLVDLLCIIGIIVALSYISYNYIEKTKVINVSIWTLISVTSVVILSMSLSFMQDHTTSEEDKKIFRAFTDRGTYRCGKLIRVLEPTAISCEINSIDNPKSTVMLIGNSHADSIKTSVSKVLTENGDRLLFMVPNNPLLKGGISTSVVFNEVLDRNVDKIAIHYLSIGFPLNNVIELIHMAISHGIEVVFIDPVPTWSEHIPQYMYFNKENGNVLRKDLHTYFDENKELFKSLDLIKSDLFNRVSVSDVFCPDFCMFKSKDGVPFYFDSNHLTLTGAEALEDSFRRVF